MKINTYVRFEWDGAKYVEVECDSFDYYGPIAHCGGGGGASGEVKFPTYQQDQHTTWMNLMDTIVDADIAGNSPYFSQTAYDPDPIIALNNAQVAAYGTLVTALDPIVDWQSAVNAVVEKLRDALPDADAIATAVDARDARLAPAHLRSIGRLASAYGDMNAYNSSAFFVAMAMLETDHMRSLNEFENQLEVQHELTRLQMIAAGIQIVLGNKHDKVRMSGAQTELYHRMNSQHVIMQTDEKNTNVEWSVKDARWDVETLLMAGNLLGAIQGGTMIPDRPKAGASALSGALSGASVGAAFGPVGALVGAGIGGLAASLF